MGWPGGRLPCGVTPSALSKDSDVMTNGHFKRLSLARRIVCDFVFASRNVPLVPIERRMPLAPLVVERNRPEFKPSWVVLFLKAFARLSERYPELKQHYVAWPWPRIYESNTVQGAVAIEREIEGERGILLALCSDPAVKSIRELDAWLTLHKTAPIDTIESYQRALYFASLPWPVRRLIWGVGTRWLGQTRSNLIGTFGITVTAGFGAATLAVCCPWTTTLHYGIAESDGTLPVRLTFDHRVIDGAMVARALAELEGILLGEVLSELRCRVPMAA
jgi:hypothetical protein